MSIIVANRSARGSLVGAIVCTSLNAGMLVRTRPKFTQFRSPMMDGRREKARALFGPLQQSCCP